MLNFVIFMPLIGSLFIAFVPKNMEKNSRFVGLFTTVLTAGSIGMLGMPFFIAHPPQWIETIRYPWIYGITYHMGIDGFSYVLMILTAGLSVAAILSTWNNVKTQLKLYYWLFLILETGVLGVFAARDLFLFFFFFEMTLIPLFFIIGIWGSHDRIQAAYQFFIYTFLGSLLMLAGILGVFFLTGSTHMEVKTSLSPGAQKGLWLLFMSAFAIKLPLWPLHHWLPIAHGEAPTSGSIWLAGILLKIAGYGMIRIVLPLFPVASQTYASSIHALSIASILYGSLMALKQTDLKKWVTYSSIAHMGFVSLGIFSFTAAGIQGAILQMISHGIISAGLFASVGLLYDRFHSRSITDYHGLATPMPYFAISVFLFGMGALALPGSGSFIAEFLVLVGILSYHPLAGVLASIGMVLASVYVLLPYHQLMFGRSKQGPHVMTDDLSPREAGILFPLAGSLFILGIFPAWVLKLIQSAVFTILKGYH